MKKKSPIKDVNICIIHPIQQPGPYLDRSSVLPLVSIMSKLKIKHYNVDKDVIFTFLCDKSDNILHRGCFQSQSTALVGK